MRQCTISCELHDYFEIACLYGYRVKLTLKDQQIIEGKALDVLTTAEKREYLIIDNGHEQQQIELNQLSNMQVLTPNAKFKKVSLLLTHCSEL
ncbi:MAG: Modulator of Rho-dependent transcription termination [Methylococcaceae bacterium NSP1-2]|nr:Rho-binding antiterminator [Methylococcaceae bacterium]OYV21437.1 MAG: Modulator of Rho-dependent transcription termination [Methylococcaceae bacterium NSP1-2]